MDTRTSTWCFRKSLPGYSKGLSIFSFCSNFNTFCIATAN